MDIQMLLRAFTIDKIIRYGNRSAAAKDIDLLIVSDDFLPVFRQKRKALIQQWIISDKPIDPICMTRKEYGQLLAGKDPYSRNIIFKGEVLYDAAALK